MAPETYFFKGSVGMTCAGSQLEVGQCVTPPCQKGCVPLDGQWGLWTEWTEPTCTQLCERHRVVKVHAECGGQLTDGTVIETKVCPYQCAAPEDCAMSVWNEWSKCKNVTTQKERSRLILNPPIGGGRQCEGALKETGDCSKPPTAPLDCAYQMWTVWSDCSTTCGDGHYSRSRRTLHVAAHGGLPCEGAIEEMAKCNRGDCMSLTAIDCRVGPWYEWSACTGGQSFTSRNIISQASGGGQACNNNLKMVKSCSLKVDCQFQNGPGGTTATDPAMAASSIVSGKSTSFRATAV